MKYDKSEIMRDAHRKYRSQNCYKSFAEALQHAWLEEKLEWWYEVTHATDEEGYWYDEQNS